MSMLQRIQAERSRFVLNGGLIPTRVYIPRNWMILLRRELSKNLHGALNLPPVIVQHNLLIFQHDLDGVKFARR